MSGAISKSSRRFESSLSKWAFSCEGDANCATDFSLPGLFVCNDDEYDGVDAYSRSAVKDGEKSLTREGFGDIVGTTDSREVGASWRKLQ